MQHVKVERYGSVDDRKGIEFGGLSDEFDILDFYRWLQRAAVATIACRRLRQAAECARGRESNFGTALAKNKTKFLLGFSL